MAHQFGIDLRGIADQPDGERLPLVACLAHLVQRLIEGTCHFIAVARLQAALDMERVNLNRQAHPLIHRHREGLRTTHQMPLNEAVRHPS